MVSLTEKYRPNSLDEIIGQDHILSTGVRMIDSIKNVVKRLKKDNNFKVDFMFAGPPGTGKTSVAICIARELFGNEWKQNFLELNASDERGIDTIRTKVKNFARIKGRRIIFLDECDYLTSDAQPALRRIMEKYDNTIFILSCNYPYKIIEPLRSRCAFYPFRKIPDIDILKRLIYIIKNENIKIENEKIVKEALMTLVKESDGDMRKAINMLEQILSQNMSLTKENIIRLHKPSLVSDAFNSAFSGNFEQSINLMEDAYISENYDINKIIRLLEKEVSKITNEKIKVKLYEKLAELDYRCTIGTNPLLQLIWFLSCVWIVKHVPDVCIIKNKI